MHRHIAKIASLALAIITAWLVYTNLKEVFEGAPVPAGAGAIALVIIYLIVYFPLLRPVADVIDDKLSTLNQRVRATRTGIGFDEIPQRTRETTGAIRNKCGICGGAGGPVCESCRIKMSK